MHWLLVFPMLVWCVPGWFASRWLLPRTTPLERAATTYLLGLVTVVPGAFTLPYLLRQPITPAWIVGAAVGTRVKMDLD